MKYIYEYMETVDSTNNEIKRRIEKGAEPGLVVSAGTQTAGRGRTGHTWNSPRADSISTSLLIRPELPPESTSRITLIAGMAVASAVEKEYGLRTEIKWPNDVLINKKKICGILTEMMITEAGEKNIIVGIGVNVHQREFPEEIREKATSIDRELPEDKRGSRKRLTERLWEEFDRYYEIFKETGDLTGLKEEYDDRLINRGQGVKVMDPDNAYEGVSRGIDETGALIVEKEDGKIEKVENGEVSVRGIYGYV